VGCRSLGPPDPGPAARTPGAHYPLGAILIPLRWRALLVSWRQGCARRETPAAELPGPRPPKQQVILPRSLPYQAWSDARQVRRAIRWLGRASTTAPLSAAFLHGHASQRQKHRQRLAGIPSADHPPEPAKRGLTNYKEAEGGGRGNREMEGCSARRDLVGDPVPSGRISMGVSWPIAIGGLDCSFLPTTWAQGGWVGKADIRDPTTAILRRPVPGAPGFWLEKTSAEGLWGILNKQRTANLRHADAHLMPPCVKEDPSAYGGSNPLGIFIFASSGR